MTGQEAGTRGERRMTTRRCLVALAALAATAAAHGCFHVESPVDGGGLPGQTGAAAAAVRIVAQPRGGTNVTEISCVIEASEIPGSGSSPIAILVSWVAPCGTHKTETFLFEGGTESYESTYREGGNPISMTFWAVVSWKDGAGSHQMRSDLAVCTLR